MVGGSPHRERDLALCITDLQMVYLHLQRECPLLDEVCYNSNLAIIVYESRPYKPFCPWMKDRHVRQQAVV